MRYNLVFEGDEEEDVAPIIQQTPEPVAPVDAVDAYKREQSLLAEEYKAQQVQLAEEYKQQEQQKEQEQQQVPALVESESSNKDYNFNFEGDLSPLDSNTGFEGFSVGNILAGFVDRGTTLAGNLVGAVDTVGDLIEESDTFAGGLGGFTLSEKDGFTYLNGKEWADYSADGGGKILRKAQSAVTDIDLGYEQGTSWDDFKNTEGFVDGLTTLAAFGVEAGLVSLPDMAAAILAAPVYLTSRTEEIAQNRASMDGRKGKPNASDVAVGGATALLITASERFGGKYVIDAFTQGGPMLLRMAKSITAEAGSEYLQEQVEFGGETIGTAVGDRYTPEEYLAESHERGLQGAVGGGTVGAVAGAVGRRQYSIDDQIKHELQKGMRSESIIGKGFEPVIQFISPEVKSVEENQAVIDDVLVSMDPKSQGKLDFRNNIEGTAPERLGIGWQDVVQGVNDLTGPDVPNITQDDLGPFPDRGTAVAQAEKLGLKDDLVPVKGDDGGFTLKTPMDASTDFRAKIAKNAADKLKSEQYSDVSDSLITPSRVQLSEPESIGAPATYTVATKSSEDVDVKISRDKGEVTVSSDAGIFKYDKKTAKGKTDGELIALQFDPQDFTSAVKNTPQTPAATEPTATSVERVDVDAQGKAIPPVKTDISTKIDSDSGEVTESRADKPTKAVKFKDDPTKETIYQRKVNRGINKGEGVPFETKQAADLYANQKGIDVNKFKSVVQSDGSGWVLERSISKLEQRRIAETGVTKTKDYGPSNNEGSTTVAGSPRLDMQAGSTTPTATSGTRTEVDETGKVLPPLNLPTPKAEETPEAPATEDLVYRTEVTKGANSGKKYPFKTALAANIYASSKDLEGYSVRPEDGGFILYKAKPVSKLKQRQESRLIKLGSETDNDVATSPSPDKFQAGDTIPSASFVEGSKEVVDTEVAPVEKAGPEEDVVFKGTRSRGKNKGKGISFKTKLEADMHASREDLDGYTSRAVDDGWVLTKPKPETPTQTEESNAKQSETEKKAKTKETTAETAKPETTSLEGIKAKLAKFRRKLRGKSHTELKSLAKDAGVKQAGTKRAVANRLVLARELFERVGKVYKTEKEIREAVSSGEITRADLANFAGLKTSSTTPSEMATDTNTMTILGLLDGLMGSSSPSRIPKKEQEETSSARSKAAEATAEATYPKREAVGPELVTDLASLPSLNEGYFPEFIDPEIKGAALKLVNKVIEGAADIGYSLADILSAPTTMAPKYVNDLRSEFIEIVSLIPLSKNLKTIKSGKTNNLDISQMPSKIHNLTRKLGMFTNSEDVVAHIEKHYPELANLLDDSSGGVTPEAKTDSAEDSASNLDDNLSASSVAPEGSTVTPLGDIEVVDSENPDEVVGLSARDWLADIDSRIKAIHKLRGCLLS